MVLIVLVDCCLKVFKEVLEQTGQNRSQWHSLCRTLCCVSLIVLLTICSTVALLIVGDIRLVVVCEEGGWRRIVRECSVRCGGPRSLSESSGVRSTTRTAFFRYPGKSKERTTERRATPPNVRVESVRTEELVS